MEAIARAFVAVEPPAAVLAALEERVCSAQRVAHADALRWGRQGWHATLRFLGRVDEPDALRDVLARAVDDVEPPNVRLGGGGAFPRVRRGTVLWVGFSEGVDALGELAACVGAATVTLGYEADGRPFRPHLTVARAPSARDLRPFVRALGDAPIGPAWRVDTAVLLASETDREGARYTEVARRGARQMSSDA
jgi:2'-5' RNA ligase